MSLRRPGARASGPSGRAHTPGPGTGPLPSARHLLPTTLATAACAVLATRDETLRLSPPPIEVRSTVGAGDSFLAGMVLRLAEGRSLADAFRAGVACGAATAMTEATELCHADDVLRLEASLAA